jgi:hypothetical protein
MEIDSLVTMQLLAFMTTPSMLRQFDTEMDLDCADLSHNLNRRSIRFTTLKKRGGKEPQTHRQGAGIIK